MIKDEEISRHNMKIVERLQPAKPQQEAHPQQESIIALPYVPISEPKATLKPNPKPNLNSEKTRIEISQQEKEVLMNIYSNLWIGIVERCKELNLSIGAGSRTIDSLIKKGFVTPWDIRTTIKGRATRFLEISAKGYIVLNASPHIYTRGANYPHTCFQNLIARHFKKLPNVIKVEIEGSLGNNSKCVDVLIRMQDGKYIAIEVAMSSVNEHSNTIKDLEAGCMAVIIVCENAKVLASVEQILAKIDPEGKQTSAVLLPQVLKCKSVEELIGGAL
ncbi:MAG: helix-turn-helix domain-containing protein [bacterium]